MSRRDPLADPAPLIQKVYAYIAYRIGDGPDAEDLTGEVFERAVKYRSSYDPARGGSLSWLIGIARRCVDGRRITPAPVDGFDVEQAASVDFEGGALERLTVARAISVLDARSRELVALRYGADLTARQIGALLDLKPNTVEVSLHRALARVRSELEAQEKAFGTDVTVRGPAPRTSP